MESADGFRAQLRVRDRLLPAWRCVARCDDIEQASAIAALRIAAGGEASIAHASVLTAAKIAQYEREIAS